MNVNANQLTGWIPIRLYWKDESPLVDWCWIGKRRFAESFFHQTVGACFELPFSTLIRPQTAIVTLAERYAIEPGLQPTGFIFHMSRCGSTLVSQMLAALPGSVVISEAGPIDSVLRARFQDPTLADGTRAEWLKWLVSALAQRRNGDEKTLFIKFDSWSVLDLSLIGTAFPDVPWIFLYRDPVEVLVSQLAHRGAQMVTGGIEPELFGMTAREVSKMLPEQYCARVLAGVCEAALRYYQTLGGMLINYQQLPDAVWTLIAGFFRVECSDSDLEAFRRAATLDAKNPSMGFESDSKRKRSSAPEAVRLAADKWLVPVYEQLEAARLPI